MAYQTISILLSDGLASFTIPEESFREIQKALTTAKYVATSQGYTWYVAGMDPSDRLQTGIAAIFSNPSE